MSRLLILGIPGLDWALLQALVDAGQMPCVGQLLEAGSSGRLSVPLGRSASTWTTLATGVLADRHGVLHDCLPRADGLTLSAPGSDSLRVPSLWQRAAAAGLAPHVAGWPALLPAEFQGETAPQHWRGGALVSAGFAASTHATETCWPMPPGLCWPAAQRELLRDFLCLPSEAPAAAVDELLLPTQRSSERLRAGAAALFAQWSSTQALGLYWLSKTPARLIALRLDGLLGWSSGLAIAAGRALPDALAPTYRWLDLLVGRYMHLLGRQAHLALVSDGGLPLGGYRGGASLLDAQAPGGLILAGPGVARDALLEGARAVDVCPTLAGLLGLPNDEAEASDGRDLLAPRSATVRAPPAAAIPPRWTEPAPDTAWSDWLQAHGLREPDLEPWRQGTIRVQQEIRLAWALARRTRGALAEAIDELRLLSRDAPDLQGVWLALGEALLCASRAQECAQLLAELPVALRTGVWGDAIAGVVAYARQDWPDTEQYLLKVVAAGPLPFNAPSWLGWARLQQQDWAGALAWFERAQGWPGERLRLWQGLGLALFQLQRYPEAASALGRAVTEAPHRALLHALRGHALAHGGHAEAARAAWWRAMQLDPKLPEAAAALVEQARQETPKAA